MGGHVSDGCLIAGRRHLPFCHQGAANQDDGTDETRGAGRGCVIAEVTTETRGTVARRI